MSSNQKASTVINELVGHRKRLRERFSKNGISGLHEHEILELLLTYVISRRDVKPLAKKLLKEFGSVNAVMDAQEHELMKIEGIGPVAASLIRFSKELNCYCLEQPLRKNRIHIQNRKFFELIRSKLGGKKKEVFMAFFVNTQGYLVDTMSIKGTVDRTCVYAREIVEEAILCHATGVILAHNHPGGSIEPSPQDVEMTGRIFRMLQMLDLRLLDHYIVAGDKTVSIAGADLSGLTL